LYAIERAGNKLPHPTLLFIYLCGAVLLVSAAGAVLDLRAIHPVTGAELSPVNLLSREGLHRILANAVTNFTGFAPVGTVLVAIMGIGVAEHSGLLATVLRVIVMRWPQPHCGNRCCVCRGVRRIQRQHHDWSPGRYFGGDFNRGSTVGAAGIRSIGGG